MKIVLIGGGSGGHITPLLAVAHKIKEHQPEAELIGVCERGSKFVHLYEDDPAIDKTYQIPAGKYRRYGGQSLARRLTDVETLVLNGRDIFRTLTGYRQARRLLKELKPDAMLIKGGFVSVPMGLAAARLGIPFMTHDSDSIPGLANRMVARWASWYATGMPIELYDYDRSKATYTGIPVSSAFKPITDELKTAYRTELRMEQCKRIVTIVGGSLGGEQLNKDICSVARTLMDEYEDLGMIHIAGKTHVEKVGQVYDELLTAEQRRRVVVNGFVSDVAVRQGAADIVVSRAGATQTAELAIQGLPVIFVPGRLAGSHQDKNARFFESHGAALVAPFGDAQVLEKHIRTLLDDPKQAQGLGSQLSVFARPAAAQELSHLLFNLTDKR